MTGYDIIALAGHYHPALPTVNHQTNRPMHLAVRGLPERIHLGGRELPPREFIVHPEFVIRQSTGPAC